MYPLRVLLPAAPMVRAAPTDVTLVLLASFRLGILDLTPSTGSGFLFVTRLFPSLFSAEISPFFLSCLVFSYARSGANVTLRGISLFDNDVARGSVAFVIESTLYAYQVGARGLPVLGSYVPLGAGSSVHLYRAWKTRVLIFKKNA